jgi:transcriptional regulator with XRE-family HTH domain
METLADLLRTSREALRLTLRDVEEKTGISNAYLSQLENRKITQPSPSVLKKLAVVYELSFARLMHLAGHPVAGAAQPRANFRRASAFEGITREEERRLLEYLTFLRTRRSGK